MIGENVAKHRVHILFCSLLSLLFSVLLVFVSWPVVLLDTAFADEGDEMLLSVSGADMGSLVAEDEVDVTIKELYGPFSIEKGGTKDFIFNLPTLSRVAFAFGKTPSVAQKAEVILRLSDASGATLFEWSLSNRFTADQFGDFVLSQGTWRLSVSANEEALSGVKVKFNWDGLDSRYDYEQEPNDDKVQESALRLNHPLVGSIYNPCNAVELGGTLVPIIDVDTFKFHLENKSKVAIRLITPGTVLYQVYDSEGNPIRVDNSKSESTPFIQGETSSEKDRITTVECGTLPAGTYLFNLMGSSSNVWGKEYVVMPVVKGGDGSSNAPSDSNDSSTPPIEGADNSLSSDNPIVSTSPGSPYDATIKGGSDKTKDFLKGSGMKLVVASGENTEESQEKVDKLTENKKKQSMLLDIHLLDEGDNIVNTDASQEYLFDVELKIPDALSWVKRSSNLKLYNIADDGQEELIDCRVADDQLSFTTGHLGRYLVLDDREFAGTPDENSDSNGTDEDKTNGVAATVKTTVKDESGTKIKVDARLGGVNVRAGAEATIEVKPTSMPSEISKKTTNASLGAYEVNLFVKNPGDTKATQVHNGFGSISLSFPVGNYSAGSVRIHHLHDDNDEKYADYGFTMNDQPAVCRAYLDDDEKVTHTILIVDCGSRIVATGVAASLRADPLFADCEVVCPTSTTVAVRYSFGATRPSLAQYKETVLADWPNYTVLSEPTDRVSEVSSHTVSVGSGYATLEVEDLSVFGVESLASPTQMQQTEQLGNVQPNGKVGGVLTSAGDEQSNVVYACVALASIACFLSTSLCVYWSRRSSKNKW